MKIFLPVGDLLLAGEGWVPRVDSVIPSAGSVGGFTEPERTKQKFIMNESTIIER